MERHKLKGQTLATFEFPKTVGSDYSEKTYMTQKMLANYATNKSN